jgi:hypothetical protein
MTKRIEFGDFQTPEALGEQACRVLQQLGAKPRSVVEPSAGLGNLLLAALRQFPNVERATAVEINAEYADGLRERIRSSGFEHVHTHNADTFEFDWERELCDAPAPILVFTNPPWVTSATVGRLGGNNVPKKSNFLGLRGMDAMTGKSNFDVSEWSLLWLAEHLVGKRAYLGAFCKMSVARKLLGHVWRKNAPVEDASLFRIDAKEHFGAAVDACFLVLQFGEQAAPVQECKAYAELDLASDYTTLGYVDGTLVSSAASHNRWRHLLGDERVRWRSGVKHDCSKVMELRRDGSAYINGYDQRVDIEDTFVFPLRKSSHLANGTEPNRFVIVTQRTTGEDTERIATAAPKTWRYLLEHAEPMDARRSSIYKGRPRFSMFGIGEYSFAPWKVAVSGLYKEPHFRLLGPVDGKPVIVDDTCYFLPFDCEALAREVQSLLTSSTARQFFTSYLFLDAKRPLTRDVLSRLDLFALARELGRWKALSDLWHPPLVQPQGTLFAEV